MIDPDLIEAREVVKASLDPASHTRCDCQKQIDAGKWDNHQWVRTALAGIKRGRELARTCDCAVCATDMRGIVPCVFEEAAHG